MNKQLLFCPGPVNVADNVKQTVLDFEIGHREDEFSVVLRSLNTKLLKLYGQDTTDKYQAIFITGSGTAANESMLSTVVEEDEHILVVSNGEFGERLLHISRLHNPNTHHLQYDWATALDVAAIEKYIKKHTISYLAVVHHETSSGMLNPIAALGELCKKYDVKLLVDTVSSLGAEIVDIEKWNITFASSSAAKAIGSLPGVSTVVGSHDAFKALKDRKRKTMFLHLYAFYDYFHKSAQTPNTPAVQTMIALEQAISNILNEGKENRIQTIKSRANALREGMKKLGLTFLLQPEVMSSMLTSVNVHADVDIKKLKSYLHEHNIIIYNGKGPLEGKIFQVGNIGEISMQQIDIFLTTLGDALKHASK